MLVEAQGLTKKYHENIIACNNICLSLEERQIFGLLGPNGAGKSTLVKMLLGLVRPTSGQALIKGRPANNPATRKSTGYLPELFRLYEWLTAEELLRFYARCYDIPVHKQKIAISETLAAVGLKGREREKIQGYSKGMQQRLALAGAILHHPDLVFLDEPTSALDPIGRRDIRDLIAMLKEQGTTILLNSHLLSEVEMTCSHLGFINHGQLIAQGEIENFLQDSHELTIQADNIDPELLSRWQNEQRLISRNGDQLVLTVINKSDVPAIVSELAARGAHIYHVDSKSRGLEEVFLDLIDHKGGPA